MEPVVKKQRVRAKNFTPLEVETLKSAVMECFIIITSKHCNGTSSITKKTQDRAWASICDKVNSVGVTKRSISEVKEKWRNLTKRAKTEITNQKKSMGKTGGGPPILIDPLLEEIASLYQDSAAFHGIPGATDAESTFTLTTPEESANDSTCSFNQNFVLDVSNIEQDSQACTFNTVGSVSNFIDSSSTIMSVTEPKDCSSNAVFQEQNTPTEKNTYSVNRTCKTTKNVRSLKDLQMEFYEAATEHEKEATKLAREKTKFYMNLNDNLPKLNMLLEGVLRKLKTEE